MRPDPYIQLFELLITLLSHTMSQQNGPDSPSTHQAQQSAQGATGAPPAANTYQDALGWHRFALFAKNELLHYQEYGRLQLTLLLGRVGGTLITAVVVAFGLMLFLLLLCAALALAVGKAIGSYPMGILIASAAWLACLSIIIALRKRIIYTPLFGAMYRIIPLNQDKAQTEDIRAETLQRQLETLNQQIGQTPTRLATELLTLLRHMTIVKAKQALSSILQWFHHTDGPAKG